MIKLVKNKARKIRKLPDNERTLVIIGLILFLWFFLAFINTQIVKVRKEIERNKKVETKQTVEVQTLTKEKVFSEIIIYGQTMADKKVPIQSRTTGTVIKKNIEYGKIVKKGDVILELSEDDRGIKLKAEKSNAKQAQIEYDSTKQLYEQGLASKNQLKKAETALNSAKSKLKSAKLDVSYSKIKAPFSGRIDYVDVKVGDYIDRKTVIGTIVDLKSMKIQAQLPEMYISRVKKGDKANIELLSGKKTSGKIDYISSIANSKTRTFTVEIKINNGKSNISDGMTAKVYFLIKPKPAHFIKGGLSAISFLESGIVGLKTVNDENKVEFYPIEVLKQEKDGIWVDGLPYKARVISTGQEYVNIGAEVDYKELKEKSKDDMEIEIKTEPNKESKK